MEGSYKILVVTRSIALPIKVRIFLNPVCGAFPYKKNPLTVRCSLFPPYLFPSAISKILMSKWFGIFTSISGSNMTFPNNLIFISD